MEPECTGVEEREEVSAVHTQGGRSYITSVRIRFVC